MEKKTIENINIARELYGKGYSGKEIAERMGVSEAMVSVWRAKSKELGIEWKYEDGTDTYGETVRVMEKFSSYISKHHKDVKDIVKEAVTLYMQALRGSHGETDNQKRVPEIDELGAGGYGVASNRLRDCGPRRAP